MSCNPILHMVHLHMLLSHWSCYRDCMQICITSFVSFIMCGNALQKWSLFNNMAIEWLGTFSFPQIKHFHITQSSLDLCSVIFVITIYSSIALIITNRYDYTYAQISLQCTLILIFIIQSFLHWYFDDYNNTYRVSGKKEYLYVHYFRKYSLSQISKPTYSSIVKNCSIFLE